MCVDDITKPGGKQNMVPMWKKLMKLVDLDEPTSILDHVYLGCTQRDCREMFKARISAGTVKIN